METCNHKFIYIKYRTTCNTHIIMCEKCGIVWEVKAYITNATTARFDVGLKLLNSQTKDETKEENHNST